MTDAFFVITDYNHLPDDISNSWVPKYAKKYLIYDRADRWEESETIKKQINVGENIYDIFDFITNNYENLPEVAIFVKADVIPRHCGEEKFNKIIYNKEYTPIENYIRTTNEYSHGVYAYVDEEDRYFENPNEINYLLNRGDIVQFRSYGEFMNSIFENPKLNLWSRGGIDYIRFSPGGCHLITKSNILRYNKNFYQTLRGYVSQSIVPPEAYLIERSLNTIFNNNFFIKEEYKYK